MKYWPSGLKQQIENVERLITECVQRFSNVGDESKAGNLKVLLVAHSMGAYMILKALRRRAEALNDLIDVHIVGAVLLFPAVTEIARSWHGSILKVQSFLPSQRGQKSLARSGLMLVCHTIDHAFSSHSVTSHTSPH